MSAGFSLYKINILDTNSYFVLFNLSFLFFTSCISHTCREISKFMQMLMYTVCELQNIQT